MIRYPWFSSQSGALRGISSTLATAVCEPGMQYQSAVEPRLGKHRDQSMKGFLRCVVLPLLLVAFWLPASLKAHPHAWIDLDITLRTDTAGHIHALDQVWIIDPMYSRYLYEDAMEHFDGATADEKLLNLGREISDNLQEYDWYTELFADERRVLGQSAPEVFMHMQDRNLHFGFRLNLERSIDPRVESVRYAIFDPTYFIEIVHSSSQPPRLDSGECALHVERPKPDPRIVARALALDFNQTGDADLGQYFAERVEIRCPTLKPE
jgi:ABC-type uncharacterized transport system substrate-binding protein